MEKANEISQVCAMKLNESEESEEASLIQRCSQNQMFFDAAGINLTET